MNTSAEPEYVKLRIMLNTNNGKQVELKSDMFAFDNKVSGDGPYVCTNINYSKSTLILLPHQEQVNIFMNESEFKNFCITSRSKKGVETSKDINVRNTLINNNIGIMLNALFPVSFPIQDAVESLCPQTSIPSDSLYLKLTKPNTYTHLNIDGTTTVTKVVWLNVMYQNPAYKQLYDIVKKYYKRMHAYIEDTFKPTALTTPLSTPLKTLTALTSWSIDTYIQNVNDVIDEIKSISLDKTLPNPIYSYNDQINMWKLYYMFKGMKKNSQEYNDFMETYVDLFINVKDKELQKMESDLLVKKNALATASATTPVTPAITSNIANLKNEIKSLENRIDTRKNRGYTNISDEQRQASNEKRFNESVQKELDFHFKYIEQLTEYMPLKRASLNPKVKLLFKDNVLNVQDFVNAMTTGDTDYCTTVDKIDDGKLYEIQVGMALVGGKVTPDVASNLRCKFDNYKLAKQINDYNAGVLFTYPYIDLKPDIERLQKALVQAKPANPPVQQPVKTGGKTAYSGGGKTNGAFGKTNGATAYSGGSKRTRRRHKNKKRRFTRKQ